jgi:class 3 adenylate cyclase
MWLKKIEQIISKYFRVLIMHLKLYSSLAAKSRKIIGNTDDYNLEERLFIATCFAGILVAILGAIIDFLFVKGLLPTIFPIIVGIIFSFFYYQARFKRIINNLIYPLIILCVITISVLWFINGGIDSANSYLFFTALPILIIITYRKHQFLVFLFLVLSMLSLFFINYFYPHLVEPYDNWGDRFSDLIPTLLYTSFIMYAVITFVIRSYYGEKQKVEVEKQNVQNINEELIRKKEILEALSEELSKKNILITEQNIELEALIEELTDKNNQITKQNNKLSTLNDNLAHKNYEISMEREESEKLLLNILPSLIATRLKEGETTIADYFDSASVIFIDQVEFTKQSKDSTPEHVVEVLNKIYTEFDKIAQKYGLEKIKTIGDCYMAASGIPVPRADHAESVAQFAIEAMLKMKDYDTGDGTKVNFRCGIDCGPVVAGVIGEKKFIYDLWGDTVNTASRMEEYGESGRIQVTERFKDHLTMNLFKGVENIYPDSTLESPLVKFEERGELKIKGKGIMKTYFLY